MHDFFHLQAEKEKKLRAMGRALADLKQEMLSAAQEGGGGGLGHSKPEEDVEERKRRDKEAIQVIKRDAVQVSLVIRGRYVLSFWTANFEFADKKTHLDWKLGILSQFFQM
jgi:hypothetical protein